MYAQALTPHAKRKLIRHALSAAPTICVTLEIVTGPRSLVPTADVLAHRGLWAAPEEQNTQKALRDALAHGFGLETDVRDDRGRLVVSHDFPEGGEQELVHLLDWCQSCDGLLALNAKADGLHATVQTLVETLPPREFFLFDMSIPQARQMARCSLPFAARISEFESVEGLRSGPYAEARYLWIDCFDSDWFLCDRGVEKALATRATILVSPEVHGRDPEAAWSWVALMRSLGHRVGLCTDLPLEFMSWQASSQVP